MPERPSQRGGSEGTPPMRLNQYGLGQRFNGNDALGASRTGKAKAFSALGRNEKHLPNDTGDPVLNSDRDVESRPVRKPDGPLLDVSAPIPPPPEPNESDYEADPSSKKSA